MNKEGSIKFNWPFFGNQHITGFLQTNIVNNNLSHFYIFGGTGDLGKSTLANYFARSILCNNFIKQQGSLPCDECSHCKQKNHTDIIIVKKEEDKKNISIEQIRAFIKQMSLGAFSGERKIGIIKEADSLSTEAANALLKTLEEPKKGVVLILLTGSVETLPATIASRGQKLFFQPVNNDLIYDYLVNSYKAPRDFARSLARLSLGKPSLAVKFLEDKVFLNEYKQTAGEILKIINSNINEKFNIIESLLPIKKGHDQKARVNYLLEVWQKIIRDLILSHLNINELITNELILDEIKKVNLPLSALMQMNKRIETSKKYLQANVSPRAVLESIVL